MSDIPLDRQVLIVSWYGLRYLDDISPRAHEPLQVGCVQELAEKTPRRGERPLDNLSGITEPCVVTSNGKAPDNGTGRSITLQSYKGTGSHGEVSDRH
jgi:hypothetical protein